MTHLDKALEVLSTVDISGAGMQYEDYLARLQEDVLVTICDDAEFTGATVDECTEIYMGWMRRFMETK